MNVKFLLIIGSAALLFLLFILKLVVNKKLSERESISWLGIGAIVLVFSLFPSMLDGVATYIGLHYSASLYFFFAIMFILLVLVRNACINTKHKKQITALGQKIALLELELREKDDT